MTNSQFIIEVIKEKYSEWLEMAGNDSSAMIIDILAYQLSKKMEEVDYYKERLKEQERVGL